MTKPAVLTAVGVVVALVVGLTGCSTGQRVDLGADASGNLIAAIAGEPDQLDPQKTSAYFSFEVLENVFDTLVEPDENLEMRPALAQSWDVSPDQLTWTSICATALRSTTAARSPQTMWSTPIGGSSTSSWRMWTSSALSPT